MQIDTTIPAQLVPIVAVVIACVAGIKSVTKIEGWATIVADAVVSLLLCTALAALQCPATWWHGPIAGVIVAVLAICGDKYLLRLMGKSKVVTIVAPSSADAARSLGLPEVPGQVRVTIRPDLDRDTQPTKPEP
jgi:hypothetical protein